MGAVADGNGWTLADWLVWLLAGVPGSLGVACAAGLALDSAAAGGAAFAATEAFVLVLAAFFAGASLGREDV